MEFYNIVTNTNNFSQHVKELTKLPGNMNLRVNGVTEYYEITNIYNENEIYININKNYDILFSVNAFDIDNIAKVELYEGLFHKIIDIKGFDNLSLPIYLLEYSNLFIKVTFSRPIPVDMDYLKINIDIGYLQNQYRKNTNFVSPLSPYILDSFIFNKNCYVYEYDKVIKIFVKNEYEFYNKYVYRLYNDSQNKVNLLIDNMCIYTTLNKINKIGSNKIVKIKSDTPFIIYLMPVNEESQFIIDNIEIYVKNYSL